MKRLLLCAATAALLVTGCKAKAPAATAPAVATPVAPVAPAAPALSANSNCANDPKVQAPAAGAAGFDVVVTLSPAAQQKLAAAKETVCVSAEFYAEVNEAGRRKHIGDEMDQVYFGGGEWRDEIAGAGSAHFTVPPAAPATMQYVDGGKEQVLINVFTGRRSSPDNLIACDAFQDDVKIAEAKGVRAACKLISES